MIYNTTLPSSSYSPAQFPQPLSPSVAPTASRLRQGSLIIRQDSPFNNFSTAVGRDTMALNRSRASVYGNTNYSRPTQASLPANIPLGTTPSLSSAPLPEPASFVPASPPPSPPPAPSVQVVPLAIPSSLENGEKKEAPRPLIEFPQVSLPSPENFDWIGNFLAGWMIFGSIAFTTNYLGETMTTNNWFTRMLGKNRERGQLYHVLKAPNGESLYYKLNEHGRPTEVCKLKKSGKPWYLPFVNDSQPMRYATFDYSGWDKGGTPKYKITYYDHENGLSPVKTVSVHEGRELQIDKLGDNPKKEKYRFVNGNQKGFVLEKPSWEIELIDNQPFYKKPKSLSFWDRLRNQSRRDPLLKRLLPEDARRFDYVRANVAKLEELSEFTAKIRGNLSKKFIDAVSKESLAYRFLNIKGVLGFGMIGGLLAVGGGLWESAHKHTMVNLSVNSGGAGAK